VSLFLTFITSLMLGMRHATDPDHVVAVTTIVSRERSVMKAAGIGAVWGIGHTITLLLVGGAIIAFKLVFDARLGLSLEMSVAVMLIVPLIDDPRWAALYLLTFGVGTIVGMALITLTIALPSLLATAHLPSLQRSLRLASGAVSLVFGIYLAHKIGFADGLFTSNPRWTPR